MMRAIKQSEESKSEFHGLWEKDSQRKGTVTAAESERSHPAVVRYYLEKQSPF